MSIASHTAPTVAGRDRLRDRRAIRIWLYAIAAMVLAMVVVGGATRLTESGLSITEWEPIHGVIPPLNESEWQEEFAKYQQIPEYQEINLGTTLAEFKAIYWWEWSHRLLGRVIGIVFLVPFLWFWATGRIERSLWPRLVAIFVMGGLQGAAGWWMVASGLTERTDVSPYRLAIHLILASLIFAYLIWVARGLRPPRPGTLDIAPGVRGLANLLIVLVFLQIYFGGLVAGLNAGLIANDWPTMQGQMIPTLLFDDEATTVHFLHRVIAYGIAILVIAQATWLSRRMPGSRTAFSSYRLVALVALQVFLGIAAVVSSVPISLALAHQFLAFVLLAGVIMHRRGMSDPIPIRS